MKHENLAQFCAQGGDPLSPAPREGHFIADRWQVLQLVKDTARQTGISEREIAVLGAHLSVLTRGPVRADQLLISYAQVGSMLERANCMDERRFRRGEARLEELGFITRKFSGNARRFPVRDGSGRIVDAYGIDLRPLFLRLEELEALRLSAAEDAQRRKALTARISARLSEVKRSAEARSGTLPQALADLCKDLRNLLRRTAVSQTDLMRAERDFEDQVAKLLADKEPADAGQSVRHIESPKKEIILQAPKGIETPHSISLIWARCSEISAFFPSPPQTPHEMNVRIVEFSAFLGLGQSPVAELLQHLGWQRSLIALDYLAGRIQDIARPVGYLKAMITQYLAGKEVAGGRIRRSRLAL